ncbi:MAG: twin-arginine translocase subunit TatC [Polyangiaceae bacterium]|nr:twin-arginine translocase subunit TatC [Polyangiaceae bacterium]
MTETPTLDSGDVDDTAEEPEEESSMTFWEHLGELRSRVFKTLLFFVLGCAVGWYFRESVLLWLTTPFITAWKASGVAGEAALHFPAPASLFLSYVKLSMLTGAVLSAPVIFYQGWSFIAPGLYAHEKRLTIPFVIASTGLFGAGAYFGWRIAFPIAFQYLLSLSGEVAGGFKVEPTVMIGDYIEFVSRMLLAFGAIFELPVIIFFLTLAGVVDHHKLLAFSRYFIVAAFALSAVITPPDILSQLLMAGPLCLLYFFSIGIAWLIGIRKKRAQASSD